MAKGRVILTQRVTITEVSTGCQYCPWEYAYRPLLPVWLQRQAIVRPLWARHKRQCAERKARHGNA